jgi:hypothetical protein
MLTMIFVGILIATVLGALPAWDHFNRGNPSGGLLLVAVVGSRTASDHFCRKSK